MKIVVAVRCFNNEEYIERFLHGYDFADRIVVSDGGSIDNSIKLLEQNKKVILHHFNQVEEKNGVRYNKDAPHMNFVLNKAKELEPDWLIFDDIDCWPNHLLRENARYLFNEVIAENQVNAFRLYMWNEDEYFPKMNNNFDSAYTSLWAWKPDKIHISADVNENHGTLIGLSKRYTNLTLPNCLLHYSWNDRSVEEKKKRYDAMGIAFEHPFNMPNAGKPVPAPEWAKV